MKWSWNDGMVETSTFQQFDSNLVDVLILLERRSNWLFAQMETLSPIVLVTLATAVELLQRIVRGER